MKSMVKPFYMAGYLKNFVTQDENVLEFDKCRLFSECDGGFDEEMATFIVKYAEEYLETEIPLLPVSLFCDFYETKTRSGYENKYKLRRDMCLYMLLAEAYERKGRFISKIIDVLWAILDEACWTLPAHMYHYPKLPFPRFPVACDAGDPVALDLQTSQTAGLLSAVSLLLPDELDTVSPYIRKRIDKTVYERAVRPYIEYKYKWSGELAEGSFINNWLTNITQNVLFATAVTVRDFETRKCVMDIAMNRLDRYVAEQPKDGLCDEGPGYWGAAGGNLFDALELIYDMSGGKISVFENPVIRAIGEYIARVHIDGPYYLNFADAFPKLYHGGKMIMRYGEKCKSETLYSFGKMLSRDENPDKYYYYGGVYRLIKDFMTKKVTEADTVTAETSVWFSTDKVAIFRESEVTSKGLFLATKGGSNAEMHNHNDVGCLVVYKNGKPVIVDPSHGSYDNGFFGPTRYERWFMKSSGHSIPTVNGIEEREGKEFSSSDEVCDVEGKSVTMNIAGAFPKDAGIIKMHRTCSLKEGEITVTDEVLCERESDVCFSFVLVDEPKLVEDGVLSVGEDVLMTYDKSLTLSILPICNEKSFEDLNIKRWWGHDNLWRVALTAHGKEAVSKLTIK